MITKLKSLFNKQDKRNQAKKQEKYISPKGQKKLSKRQRKDLYEKENRKEVNDEIMIDNKINEYYETHQVETVKVKKIKVNNKIFSLLSGALLLASCTLGGIVDSGEKIQEDNPIIEKDEVVNIGDTVYIPEDEVNSEMDGPIAIGDMATLRSDANYYETASMIDDGVSVSNNLYVNEQDYNVISAVAIIDEDSNIRYVNYKEGYELYKILGEIEYLGLTNYQIVLHYGPLNEEQKTSDVNAYQLGWSNINSMNKMKSKKY